MFRLQTLGRIGLATLLGLTLAACATSRGEMALAVPGAGFVAGSANVAAGKVAVIDEVVDRRVFEANPSDPSIPSLKKGSDYALDAEGRKRAIARKRSGYGMALGDILLEGTETVETLARGLLASGLEERGYRVLAAGETAPDDALRVKADINQFWAWFSPGFWSVSMEAKLLVDIQATSPAGTQRFSIPAYGINKGQSGREANWRLAYDRAFEDYLAKQRTEFGNRGL